MTTDSSKWPAVCLPGSRGRCQSVPDLEVEAMSWDEIWPLVVAVVAAAAGLLRKLG
jgi:hypothetical protein